MATAPNTQMAAYASAKTSAKIVRDQVLEAIKIAGKDGLTAHECASFLDIDKATVQPRTSELHSESLIMDSGQRRHNASGKRAIVWIAA